jgi:hypothetical protein
MRFWLVNSGTSADPMVSRPVARFRAWEAANGPVQGFSRRPAKIAVNDILIHRAVGTNGDRLIAVGIVTGPPVEEAVELWPWRLPRRITHLCTAVDIAPRAHEVGISAHAMRTFKELDPQTGQRARDAIEAVAQPWAPADDGGTPTEEPFNE